MLKWYFKMAVTKSLVKDFSWEFKEAKKWIDEHIDYMTAMCASSSPPWKTAFYINNMKKEN
ncbi:MAG: hypothetical protein HMLIMOIP_002570 [Candidatus Nitrosomirales archaeon]|jgi:hypothetical protein